MHLLLAELTLLASASALVARGSTCCFTISVNGEGTVGQLSDGQNRLGGGLPCGSYCIENGGLTDGEGRGCILTSPTTQFQCDTGATPATGFSVSCSGTVELNGDSTFWQCPTGDDDEYNIYTTPPPGQGGCSTITLQASGCQSGCPPPAPSSCPDNLNGNYQFPHLLIPVDSSNPDEEEGTSYDGTITPTIDTLAVFDIPSDYAGQTCTLVFLFPTQAELQTSSFTFSGSGGIDFAEMSSDATQQTTWNSKGSVATDYGVTNVSPGNSYVITTFSCPANSQITFQLASSGGLSLTYFQDYNPSPIGVYITSC